MISDFNTAALQSPTIHGESPAILRASTSQQDKDLNDDLLSLRKQENEHKKEKAVSQQKIEFLNLHVIEYQKREENLKKLNETIMESLNDLTSQGSNSKIIKELQINQEQHNKDLLEGKLRSQQANVILEKENRELKDEINCLHLKIKDLEMEIEKEKMNNQRILEQLDRGQIEIESYKSQILIDEQLQLQKLEQEKKIKDLTLNNQQTLEQTRISYEEKIKSLYAGFDKEKSSLEHRIQKNLNTIQKYQTHIESQSNITLNSTFIQGQNKGDVSSCIRSSEIEIELKGEIVKLTNEKNKIQSDLLQSQELLGIKDEKIALLQLKNLDYEKTIDELKRRQVNNQYSSQKQRKSSIQSQIPLPSSAQRISAQFDQSPDLEIKSKLKNQRSSSINTFNQQSDRRTEQGQFQQQQIPKGEQSSLRESLNRSQVQQRISNLNSFVQDQTEFEALSMISNNRRNMIPESHSGLQSYPDQESDTLENLTITHEGGASGSSYFNMPISSDIDQQFINHPTNEMSENQIKFYSQNRYNQKNRSHQQSGNPHFFKETHEEFQDHQKFNNPEINQIGIKQQENDSERYEYIGQLQTSDWSSAAFPNQTAQKYNQCQFQGTQSDLINRQKASPLVNNENHQQQRVYYNQRSDSKQKMSFQQQQNMVIPQPQPQSNLQPQAQTAMTGERTLQNITNQSQYLTKSMSTSNTGINYKTLILCEVCGQCFIPSELVDHMAVCDPQLAGICISERREEKDEPPIDSFNQVISRLNYEKQVVEQKLLILENHLKNSNNSSGAVAQDRDRLKQELESIMIVLGKAKMNQTIKSEEQEACTVALKNEITFLIKKLLKAKGSLQEDCISIQKNGESMSYISQEQQQLSPYTMKHMPRTSSSSGSAQKGQQHRKDNSSFIQKGRIDCNTYTNVSSSIQSQGHILDSSYLRESYQKNTMNDYLAIQRPHQQFYSKKGSASKSSNHPSNNNMTQHQYF